MYRECDGQMALNTIGMPKHMSMTVNKIENGWLISAYGMKDGQQFSRQKFGYNKYDISDIIEEMWEIFEAVQPVKPEGPMPTTSDWSDVIPF